MSTPQKQAAFVKTALRVPPDLHAAIHEAAKDANRSFNGELIHRLRTSFGRTLPKPAQEPKS